MIRCVLLTALVGSSLVSLGRAQSVTGSGTTNTVAQFTGATTIGNSPIVQFDGNIGINSPNPTAKLDVKDFRDVDENGFGPSAIHGLVTCSLNNFCSAVRGDATTPNSGAIGVVGARYGPQTGGGGGVLGITFGNSDFTYGARGDAAGLSGAAIGVMGTTLSPQGDAARFVGVRGPSGTIIRGDYGPPGAGEVTVFRVDGTGRVFADGGFRPFGADFAEALSVVGDRSRYEPGDLLVIDPAARDRLALSGSPYSQLVAGVYSTNPGVVASQRHIDDPAFANDVPLAVVGIVPCKVTAEGGSIAPGDLLVSSSAPGRAMKGTDRARMLGAIVGKALEPLRTGTGVIQVLVTLQ